MKKRGRPKGSKNKVSHIKFPNGQEIAFNKEHQKREFLKGVDTSMWQGGVIDNPTPKGPTFKPTNDFLNAPIVDTPEIRKEMYFEAIEEWYLAKVELDLAEKKLLEYLK